MDNQQTSAGISHVLGKRVLASILVVTLCLSPLLMPSGAAADDEEETDSATEAGLSVLSFLVTIPYGVAKIVYAGVGGIVGGFTWILTGGDNEAAKAVWEPSIYGTYVITPEHLKGEKPIRFFGVSPYEDEHMMEPTTEME
ncbi:MAG: hypothetical protein D6704_03160 [Nitrospirae bacterium]|nr:MAG: hypothetical protein D6704_03160 [Nitrospirota bacterium]